MPAVHTAFVAFGSNLGNRRVTVEKALRALSAAEGISVTAVSRLYETAPVGGPAGQRPFLNGVAELAVVGSPRGLLKMLLAVERRLGRRRAVRWGPRTIDLDLLAFDSLLMSSPSLTLPHPRYHERRFVLKPFCDVVPDFVHPVLKEANRALLRRLTGGERVTMMGAWKKSRFIPFEKRKKVARPSSRSRATTRPRRD